MLSSFLLCHQPMVCQSVCKVVENHVLFFLMFYLREIAGKGQGERGTRGSEAGFALRAVSPIRDLNP